MAGRFIAGRKKRRREVMTDFVFYAFVYIRRDEEKFSK